MDKMEALIENITETYKYINEDLAHPVTKEYLLFSSPFYLLAVIYVYYKFVTSWGPAFMAERPAYDIKIPMIVYNMAQIVLSAILLVGALRTTYISGNYSLRCQKINYEDSEADNGILYYVWMYAVVKVVDLIDTVFFILRKKFNHASFLHLYHHIGMTLLGYVGLKYFPGGHGVMLGVINTLVHMVMYSYYLIALVRPDWVHIWWKKYITQLQIAQFVALLLHFSHTIFNPSCEYPKWAVVIFIPHNIFMTVLFLDFYIKTYIRTKKQ